MRLTFYAWQLSYDQRVTLSFLVFNVNGWLKMPNLHLKQLGCRMGSKGVTQCGTALCSDFDLDHSTTLNDFHPFRGFPYLWGGREDRIITWGYASTGCPFPTSRWPWIQPVLRWLLCAPDTVSGGIVPLSRPTPDRPFSLSHAQSIPRYVQVLSMCFICDFNGKLDILSPKQK